MFIKEVFAQTGIVGTKPNTLSEIDLVLGHGLGLIIPLGSVVLFIVLLFGGIKFITAGANPGQVEQAKKTITYAIIGTILLAMAYLILVVIEALTGANVTTFNFDI